MTSFFLEGELTDLNTYVNAERRNRFIGAKIKKTETARVAYAARKLKPLPQSAYPVTVQFEWFTKNLRKDADNVTFSKKFILDGLVDAGVLAGDGRKHVALAQDMGMFVNANNSGVFVKIVPYEKNTTTT